MVICKGCTKAFIPGRRTRTASYCSLPCYRSTGAGHTIRKAAIASGRVSHERAVQRRVGTSCPIRVEGCSSCGTLMTKHGSSFRGEYCSHRCYSREYQRRYQPTAIRYWTIDDSPEARDLARTYFELRQQLRTIRHA